MAIQITNDPINQFLDNLPRYALELRRQDQQRAQFNRQMELREQAARNQQTLFDLTRNQQKFQSEVLKAHYNAQADLRNAKREREKYTSKNQNLIEQHDRSFYSKLRRESYDDFLKRKKRNEELTLSFANALKLPNRDKNISRVNEVNQAIEGYNNLPDVSKIRPKEIPVPAGVEFSPSLYNFAINNNIQKSIDDELEQLRNIFNIPGTFTPSEFQIQEQDIERLR